MIIDALTVAGLIAAAVVVFVLVVFWAVFKITKKVDEELRKYDVEE